MKKFVLPLVLLAITSTYALFVHLSNKNLDPTGTAYYNLLGDAFLHGRVNIIPGGITYDLSEIQGKWYLYWGASPVLFVLPFYLFSGVMANDIIYTTIAGLLNVFIFALVVEEFTKYFQIKLSTFLKVFVVVNFALISPNFSLSLVGTIWYSNQVISILFLLLYYLFFFKFLSHQNKFKYLALCLIFFNLAWLARLSLVMHGLLLLYPLIIMYPKQKEKAWRAVVFMSTFIALGLLGFMAYNYARFHRPFEIGYHYQIAGDRFKEFFREGKLFSISFIPHNATYYFLNHILLRFEPPYMLIDKEGNSIFSVYPLTILLFYFLKRAVYTAKNKLFLVIMGIVLGLNLLLILSNLGTGWIQFGSRYFFDLIPGVFLLTLFVLKYVQRQILWTLLLYGLLVNLGGVYIFYTIVHPR